MAFRFLGQNAGLLPCIDRYELIAEIASGGMASVYLARVVGVGGFQRLFAIKCLHPHLGSDEEFVSMFLDEARIVAGIRHPNVVPVLEVGASERGYYLVMEYVEGDTLGGLAGRAMQSKMPIPTSVAIRICLDTLAGLHAAHEHVDSDGNPYQLVHRDVSPQNILLDNNGVAKIADFGVARAATKLSSTRAGQLKGKVAYMAPEQARGEIVNRQADLFSTGVVLWEALANARLFEADNDAASLNRLMFEPIPPLHDLCPHLPESITEIVHKALQREKEKRYGTAVQFANELREAARVNNLLGSQDDVKNYMDVILGEEIVARRTEIRQFLATVQGPGDPVQGAVMLRTQRPNQPGRQISSVSGAAMEIPSAGVSYPSASDPAAELDIVVDQDDIDDLLRSSRRRKNKLLVALVTAMAMIAAAAVWILVVQPSSVDTPSAAAIFAGVDQDASTEPNNASDGGLLADSTGADSTRKDVQPEDVQPEAALSTNAEKDQTKQTVKHSGKKQPRSVTHGSNSEQKVLESEPMNNDLKSNPYR